MFKVHFICKNWFILINTDVQVLIKVKHLESQMWANLQDIILQN